MPHWYRELRPSERLARYVECYWRRAGHQVARQHRVLPDGCVDILFSTSNDQPLGLSVVGLMTAPATVRVEAGSTSFGIRFRPGMAAAFLPEAGRLNDTIERLENVWGGEARSLYEQLAKALRFEEMAAVAEQFLRPRNPPDAAQRALWRVSRTDVPLDRLATEAGLSARSLRRVCMDRAGVSPKYLRRILRFRRSVECIHATEKRGAQPAWAHLAAACGYFDQAHFIREFREFAGSTPGHFLQSSSFHGALESENDDRIEAREPDRLH